MDNYPILIAKLNAGEITKEEFFKRWKRLCIFGGFFFALFLGLMMMLFLSQAGDQMSVEGAIKLTSIIAPISGIIFGWFFYAFVKKIVLLSEEDEKDRQILEAKIQDLLAKEIIEPQREGWPKMKIDQSRNIEELLPILELTTGWEEIIESQTENSYERLTLLVLAWTANIDPRGIPLDKDLIDKSFASDDAVSEYGFDSILFIEGINELQSLFAVDLLVESEQTFCFRPTVEDIAKTIEKKLEQKN